MLGEKFGYLGREVFIIPNRDFPLSVLRMAGLLDPLQVRNLQLRNRIVMPPMQSGRAGFQGEVTDRLVNFYVRRSACLGLPIVEHAYISIAGKIGPKQLGVHNDELIPGLTKLALGLHSVGAPAVLQITHAGGVANKKVIGTQPVGPSERSKVRELQKPELDAIAGEFAEAAERTVKAGFDGVELHGAHGYLLCQFFSPLFNRRTDEFGGCLENRMRFPLQVVTRVRDVLKDKLLVYRLGADDLAPNGTHIEDAAVFAQKLEAAGVDILDVSGGMCGADPKQLRHVRGYFIPQAREIKKTVNVPVVGVGRITNAKYADELVRDGSVDLVAVGRALARDALWAEKAAAKLSQGLRAMSSL